VYNKFLADLTNLKEEKRFAGFEVSGLFLEGRFF